MAYTRQEIAVYEKIRMRSLASQLAIAFWSGIILIILKLLGALTLNWWWTTSPIWIAVAHTFLGIVHIAALRTANNAPAKKP